MFKKNKIFSREDVEKEIQNVRELTDEEKEKFVMFLDDIMLAYAHQKANEDFGVDGQEKPVVRIDDAELNEIINAELEKLMAGFIDHTIYTRGPNKIRLKRRDLRRIIQEEVQAWAQREVDRVNRKTSPP